MGGQGVYPHSWPSQVALWLVAPAAMISSMIGRTLAANRRAFAFTAATPRFAALARSGLPNRVPRALAAARAALVRSEIAKLDRLSRNLAFIATLMESGVEFIAVDNPHAASTDP